MNKIKKCKQCECELGLDKFELNESGRYALYCNECKKIQHQRNEEIKKQKSKISIEQYKNKLMNEWYKNCITFNNTGNIILHPYSKSIDTSKKILVDTEIADEIIHTPWLVRTVAGKDYVYRVQNRIWPESNVALHRYIMRDEVKELEKVCDDQWICVDHINGNTLDNRRINLRVCTIRQNVLNSKAYKDKSNTSKYKGVYIATGCKGYSVSVGIGNLKRAVYATNIEDEKLAALVYDKIAKQYFGEYAWTNEQGFAKDFTKVRTEILKDKLDDVEIRYHKDFKNDQ